MSRGLLFEWRQTPNKSQTTVGRADGKDGINSFEMAVTDLVGNGTKEKKKKKVTDDVITGY